MAKTYLVVGAAPHEDRRGRTFYENPSVFLLDNRAIDFYYHGEAPKVVDFSRYTVADFTDVAAMTLFSSENTNKFDIILFDVAVVKFFEGDLRSLPFFWNTLKPGGQLIMDANVYSSLPWTQFWNGHPTPPYPANFNAQLRAHIPDIMTKIRVSVFETLRKLPTSSIESTTYGVLRSRDPILADVYRIERDDAHVFVVKKLSLPSSPNANNIDIGGGYRKRRYRRKTSRKTKRKQRR